MIVKIAMSDTAFAKLRFCTGIVYTWGVIFVAYILLIYSIVLFSKQILQFMTMPTAVPVRI